LRRALNAEARAARCIDLRGEHIAEGDKVAAHFRCSGTHRGEWRGAKPTGRTFEDVDEIYIFEVREGRLTSALGVEDNLERKRQLGIEL